jgi:hypothetical protein
MLIIVGHGPSVVHVPGDFIDQHTVCRLRRAKKTLNCGKGRKAYVGTRTDIVCSNQSRYRKPYAEFWHLKGKLRKLCVDRLRPYSPKFWKPSTGLSAVIIARHKGYEEIGVMGFDFTLHPETAKNWTHDVWAESECLKDLGVIDLCENFINAE